MRLPVGSKCWIVECVVFLAVVISSISSIYVFRKYRDEGRCQIGALP